MPPNINIQLRNLEERLSLLELQRLTFPLDATSKSILQNEINATIDSRLIGDFFGDGSDGDVVIRSNTTLTTDKYYKNLSVLQGFTLTPAGYRIFVQNECLIAGTVAGNGVNGGNGGNGGNASSGTGGTGGTGGSAPAALATEP